MATTPVTEFVIDWSWEKERQRAVLKGTNKEASKSGDQLIMPKTQLWAHSVLT